MAIGSAITIEFDFSKAIGTDVPRAAAKMEQIFKSRINGRLLSEPLGRISSSASELSKSLEAANARVLAFGASVSIIYGVQKAFQELVKSTINVEKRLADINAVLGENAAGLSKFSDKLFDIAKKTGQSFDTVSDAALEFSRQGLSVQETLKRTNDALILTRLTGLSAKDSVESLTASVNSFSKSLLTTTDVINKFASVDAAFAVSSADLAEGLKRVGSTAQDAGVGINELIGLITSAQQITSRGGAVIGNALKTIFAKISNPEAIKQLQDLGVQIDNSQNGIQKLRALSDALKTADVDTAALIKKTAGGVYQLNQISAILSDLSSQYSIYARATQQAGTATDEATKRNLDLNKTLSASVNELQQNLTQAFSKIGNSTIKNPLTTLLGGTNELLKSFNEGAETIGQQTGEILLSAISKFISGPGAVYFGVIGLQLLNNFRKFTLESIKELRSLNLGQQERLANESAIVQILSREPELQAQIVGGQISIAKAQEIVLAQLQSELLIRERIAATATAIAPKLKDINITFDKNLGTPRRTFANGFLPNAEEIAIEKAQAKAGGYTPGQIRTTNIPGLGSVVYNTAEKIVNYPGFTQPAIIPPQNSKAGIEYKKNFKAALGFNPYQTFADGFFPGDIRQQFVPPPTQNAITFQRISPAFKQEAGYQMLLKEEGQKLAKEYFKGKISLEKLNKTIDDIAKSFKLTNQGILDFNKFVKSGGKIQQIFSGEANDIYNKSIVPERLLPPPPTAKPYFNQFALIPANVIPQSFPGLPQSFEFGKNISFNQNLFDDLAKKDAESKLKVEKLSRTVLNNFTLKTPGYSTVELPGLASFYAKQNRQTQINDLINSGSPDTRTRESLLEEDSIKFKKIQERLMYGSEQIEKRRLSEIEKLTQSSYSLRNIFKTKQITEQLSGLGFQPEEVSKLKDNIRGVNQQRAFNLSLIAPLVTAGLEAAIGSQTRGQRIASSSVSALGNAIAYGATGFSLSGGNPIGAAVGAGAGLLTSLPSILEAITSNIPDLTKALEDLGNASSKSRASLANFTESTQKLFGINSGEISYRPQDKLKFLERQNAEVQTIDNEKIRTRVQSALASGDINGAISGFTDFDSIRQQKEQAANIRLSLAKRASRFANIQSFQSIGGSTQGLNIAGTVKELPLSKTQQEEASGVASDLFKLLNRSINSEGTSLTKVIQGNQNFLSGIQGAKSITDFINILNEVGAKNDLENLGDVLKDLPQNAKASEVVLSKLKEIFSNESIRKANEQIINSADGARKTQKSLFDLGAQLQKSSDLINRLGQALSTNLIERGQKLQQGVDFAKISREGFFARANFGAGAFTKNANDASSNISDLIDKTLISRQTLRQNTSEKLFGELSNIRTASLVQVRQTAENNAGKGLGNINDASQKIIGEFGKMFKVIGFDENTKASDITPENINKYIEGVNKVIGQIGGPLGTTIKGAADEIGDPKIIGDFVGKLRGFLESLEKLRFEFDNGNKVLTAEQQSGILKIGRQARENIRTIGFENNANLRILGTRNAGEINLTQNQAGFEVSESLRNFSDDIKNFGKVGLPKIQAEFISSTNRINNLSGFQQNQNVAKGLLNLQSSASPLTSSLTSGITSIGQLNQLAQSLSIRESVGEATKEEKDTLFEIQKALQDITAEDIKINIERQKGLDILKLQTENAKELYKLQSTFADFRAAEAIDTATNNIRVGSFRYSDLGNVARTQFDYGINDFKRDAVLGVADVSQQIKRSFSEATASIIKDGVSFGTAFKGVLLSVLGSIVDKTSAIGTDFLFKGLSTAGQSILSTFSTGGLVSNGSGVKDDVPALLTGGEYVIKKSAVNKIGKANLDAINYGSDSAIINLQNEFAYNDPKRPTAGYYATSNALSSFGLTDTDISRTNATKFARADAFYAYQKDKYDYDIQQQNALNAFYKQKKNRAYGAIFSAALGVAGAGLTSGLGSIAGSAVKTGGTYVNSITSSSPYGDVYGNVGLRRNMGGIIPVNKYASGGMIFGGQSSTDNIPAMLTAGEYVIRKDRVDKLGTNILDKLNYGYAGGGVVSAPQGAGSSSVLQGLNDIVEGLNKNNINNQSVANITNNISINIDSNGKVNSSVQTDVNSKEDSKEKRNNKEQTAASAKQLQVAILEVINKESKQGGSIRAIIDSRIGKG